MGALPEVTLNPTLTRFWPACSALVLLLGCAGRAFFRADPPVNAQGVTMALVDQGCDLDQDPEVASAYVQDTMITVQVTNSSPAPATVDTARLRLGWNQHSLAPDSNAESVSVKSLAVRWELPRQGIERV